jgi:hypothetical protein
MVHRQTESAHRWGARAPRCPTGASRGVCHESALAPCRLDGTLIAYEQGSGTAGIFQAARTTRDRYGLSPARPMLLLRAGNPDSDDGVSPLAFVPPQVWLSRTACVLQHPPPRRKWQLPLAPSFLPDRSGVIGRGRTCHPRPDTAREASGRTTPTTLGLDRFCLVAASPRSASRYGRVPRSWGQSHGSRLRQRRGGRGMAREIAVAPALQRNGACFGFCAGSGVCVHHASFTVTACTGNCYVRAAAPARY